MGNNPIPYEVVHCSSWDDDYSPEELAKASNNSTFTTETFTEKCQGWQTPKCPEYPQDLIIHLLSGPSHINKVQVLSHHFKIATRIDVYVGILKDPEDVLEDIVVPDSINEEEEEQDNMLIEFTRLGYVCFDNNARAQFGARELKSIKINTDGEYVRLVIRNCHRNRLNTHNQVGILALNVLGQPIHTSSNNSSSILPVKDDIGHSMHHSPFDDSSLLSSSTRRTSVSSNQSILQRYPSSNLVEIELQQWTTILLTAEEEAVKNEAYHEAKTYKYLGDKLERFTKILSDLEIGKRHAVETKDYDEAEKIKDDIREIKQTAEALLKQANIEIRDGRLMILEPSQIRSPEPHLLEGGHDLDETLIGSEQPQPQLSSQPLQRVPNESWMVVAEEEEEDEEEEGFMMEEMDPESVPEVIMDEERKSFYVPIQLFGEDMIACILSIKSKCRTRGLSELEQEVKGAYNLARNDQHVCVLFGYDEHSEAIEGMAEDFVNSVLMLVQEAVMDSREAIVSMAISIWYVLNDYMQLSRIVTEDIIEWLERTFCGLLKRTGDSNPKIKQEAVSLILILAQAYSTPPFTLLPLYIGKPERMIHNHKEAKARIELVEATVTKLGVDASAKKKTATSKLKKAIPLDDLMQFVVAYLGHNHDEVREAAVKLIITISDQIGFNLVSTYIDESLKLSLADTVKKLVDKDSINTKTIKNDTKKTISELRALTVTRAPAQRTTAVKRSAATNDTKTNTNEKKRPASSTIKKTTTTTNTRTTTRTTKPKEQQPPPVKDEPPVINENSVCIFCDEMNPEFNEDTLIKHYYHSCPVLTNCPMCKVITEISTLNEHMLNDCEKHHLIKECTRCHLAIPVEQWLQHSLKQTCPNIEPPNDAGWKAHLMTGDGCPKLKKSRSPNKKPQQQQTTTKKKVTRVNVKK
ncbi:hypothetical protein G6F57_006826 [Rhizopus arrhizus]|nr:hypothetical protein G6F30_006393 [Rhizopus arrhizus]KAG0982393.1 hypothetical protein G6F29_006328 [Rhizopus arrhizus]KAG0992572.1 hypothetical protein G6F28_007517 [Rhizopus arrhizus]KAG1006587.1 hypothetical protein G6F27_008169 [Rhizopus arrhizus]KAG1029706.1 hypothetical protein G6F26_001515 [Rhizopus arrhizus]